MIRRRWLGVLLATVCAALGTGSMASLARAQGAPAAARQALDSQMSTGTVSLRSSFAPLSTRQVAEVGELGGGIDSVSVIAQNGFDSTQNSYAWGMAWFKGKLYVGTGRDVVCTEREDSDYYYPFAHRYVTHPEPGVHCPKNPYAMNLRAEIWQYTPRTNHWVMVYRAPVGIRNPRDRRYHLSPDIAYRGMTVVTNKKGHQALFVSGVSADEWVPQAAQKQPPRLLRTFDGRHFHNIARSIIVRRTGNYTDHRAIGFRGMQVWRGHLYVLASASLTGDGGVFRVDNPWSKHSHFTQVSPPWMYVFELQTFHGSMYFGSGNGNTGYGVWKLQRSKRPYHFTPIVTHGAGRGHLVTSVISMTVYRNQLYVGAVGWYCVTCNALPTTEMIRINAKGRWQVVVGAKRFVASQSRSKAPISGLGDGFDNIFNSHMWRMAVSGKALYVGTLDWSWLLQKDKTLFNGHPGVLSSVLAGELGFDMWATCDGHDFFPVTRDAFGVDEYDFGVRTLLGVKGGYYVGTANHAHGTRIFHEQGNVCQSLPDTRAARSTSVSSLAAPAAPQDLLTDAQRNGTVLSWQPTGQDVKYAVMRAAYTSIPYTFQKPTVYPDGFESDDAVPVPATPGSKDSASTKLTFPGNFKTLGTTDSSHFVDSTRRPGAKYLYQVVAESASGKKSIGSNVQVVPDPRPPATFGQLGSALPASQGKVVADMAKVASCPRTLADLRRLARSASNEDARELAYRLQRRLEYRNLAGGPLTGSLTCG